MAYAVDPDKGTKVWEYTTSAGAALGGQWGVGRRRQQAYFGVNGPPRAACARRRSMTGDEVWSKPAAERLCGTVRGCSAAQGAAVTAIPGIVFAGSMDGGVRAYSTARRIDRLDVRHQQGVRNRERRPGQGRRDGRTRSGRRRRDGLRHVGLRQPDRPPGQRPAGVWNRLTKVKGQRAKGKRQVLRGRCEVLQV